MVAVNKDATEPSVPFGKVEVITSKVSRSPPWVGWPLWNISVTNGYVQLVFLNTYRSFLHSRLIIGFITRLYNLCSFKYKIESDWLTPLHFQTDNVTKDVKTVECLEINYQCYFVYKTPVMIRSVYFSLWYKN